MSTYLEYQLEIEFVIAAVKRTDWMERRTAIDGTEVYAYPMRDGRIAWGVNGAGNGFNILRGVRNPDGTDEAVM